MKHKKLIRSLAIFLLAPAFSIGVAQASSTVDKSGPQGNLSQMGAFQMADSSPGNKGTLLTEGNISPQDLDLVHIVDDENEVLEILNDFYQEYNLSPNF